MQNHLKSPQIIPSLQDETKLGPGWGMPLWDIVCCCHGVAPVEVFKDNQTLKIHKRSEPGYVYRDDNGDFCNGSFYYCRITFKSLFVSPPSYIPWKIKRAKILNELWAFTREEYLEYIEPLSGIFEPMLSYRIAQMEIDNKRKREQFFPSPSPLSMEGS